MPESRPRVNCFWFAELCWLFCCPPSPSRIPPPPKLVLLPPEPTYTVLVPEQRATQPAPAKIPGRPRRRRATQPAQAELGAARRVQPTPKLARNWQYSQRELDPIDVFFWSMARGRPLQPLHATFLTR